MPVQRRTSWVSSRVPLGVLWGSRNHILSPAHVSSPTGLATQSNACWVFYRNDLDSGHSTALLLNSDRKDTFFLFCGDGHTYICILLTKPDHPEVKCVLEYIRNQHSLRQYLHVMNVCRINKGEWLDHSELKIYKCVHLHQCPLIFLDYTPHYVRKVNNPLKCICIYL